MTFPQDVATFDAALLQARLEELFSGMNASSIELRMTTGSVRVYIRIIMSDPTSALAAADLLRTSTIRRLSAQL